MVKSLICFFGLEWLFEDGVSHPSSVIEEEESCLGAIPNFDSARARGDESHPMFPKHYGPRGLEDTLTFLISQPKELMGRKKTI